MAISLACLRGISCRCPNTCTWAVAPVFHTISSSSLFNKPVASSYEYRFVKSKSRFSRQIFLHTSSFDRLVFPLDSGNGADVEPTLSGSLTVLSSCLLPVCLGDNRTCLQILPAKRLPFVDGSSRFLFLLIYLSIESASQSTEFVLVKVAPEKLHRSHTNMHTNRNCGVLPAHDSSVHSKPPWGRPALGAITQEMMT